MTAKFTPGPWKIAGYAELKDVHDFLRRIGYDTRLVAAALAKADGRSTAAPSADIARAVVDAMLDELIPDPLIIEPLDVLAMEDQAGIDATDDLEHYVTPLPSFGRYVADHHFGEI